MASGRGGGCLRFSFATNPGSTSAQKTKSAVMSLRSFGLSPHRSAMATSRRKITEPMMAPDDRQAEAARAGQRFANDDARQTPHDHADAHLRVGEALVLRKQRTGKRDEAVRERETEHDIAFHVGAERADHLRIVTSRPHRRAKVGAEEGKEEKPHHRRPHE